MAKIINTLIPNFENTNYIGSISNPYPSYGVLNSLLPATRFEGIVYMASIVGNGVIEMVSDGISWSPTSTFPIIDMVDPHTLIAPGDTVGHHINLCTIPGGMFKDNTSWMFQFTYVSGASNVGNDSWGIALNGHELYGANNPTNTIFTGYGSNRRDGLYLNRNFLILTTGMSAHNPFPFYVNFGSDVIISSRITAANGANSLYFRKFSLTKV